MLKETWEADSLSSESAVSYVLSVQERLAKFLTALDLARGYWQVPMAPGSREKTAFVTEQGLFQFTVMPFGLQGAPATFQQ